MDSESSHNIVTALLDLKPLLLRIAEALEQKETPTPSKLLLTKADVAKMLGGSCSVRRVERLMKLGKLRKVDGLGERTVRFRSADIERLVSEGRVIGQRRL